MADLDDLPARTLARLALLLCSVSALTCGWELLALQAPDSPFHVGVLSGPVAQLRNFSFALGLGALGLAWLWRSLFTGQEGRVVLWALVLAAALQIGALFYAATQGMVGVQLLDPRLDARLVIYARGAGHVLLSCALLVLLARSLRRPRSTL